MCEVQRSASEIHRAPVQIGLTGTVTVSTRVLSFGKWILPRKTFSQRGGSPMTKQHIDRANRSAPVVSRTTCIETGASIAPSCSGENPFAQAESFQSYVHRDGR